MRNFIQRGDTLSLTAPTDAKAGDLVVIGAFAGVAAVDAKAGEAVEVALTGVFALPKTTGIALAAGGKAYWDAAAKAVTTEDDGNRLIGAATAAALAAATSVNVRLDGSAR
jgi:predicted RecA/RadA family phage recombinase